MLLEEEKCGCEHDHEEDECCCGHHHEHHEDECCCGHHHDHPEIGEECDCPDCEGHDHDRTISFIDEETGEEYKGLFLFHTDLDGKQFIIVLLVILMIKILKSQLFHLKQTKKIV